MPDEEPFGSKTAEAVRRVYVFSWTQYCHWFPLAASSDQARILRNGVGVGSPVDWCRPEINVVTQLRRPIHE